MCIHTWVYAIKHLLFGSYDCSSTYENSDFLFSFWVYMKVTLFQMQRMNYWFLCECCLEREVIWLKNYLCWFDSMHIGPFLPDSFVQIPVRGRLDDSVKMSVAKPNLYARFRIQKCFLIAGRDDIYLFDFLEPICAEIIYRLLISADNSRCVVCDHRWLYNLKFGPALLEP